MKRIVIVGAGLAGTSAAYALRQASFDGEIVVMGEESEPPYDRPPLSKDYLVGTKVDEQLALHPSTFYDEHSIDLRLGRAVTRLLPDEGGVEIDGAATLSADKVLLATGGRSRRLRVPGANLAGVHYLRTIQDARDIRDSAADAESIVVVGGGFIGAEVAASLVMLGKRVTIIETFQQLLQRAIGSQLGLLMSTLHRSYGVEVRTGCSVIGIHGHPRVSHVELTDGSLIETDMVLVGIGMAPSDELARAAGIGCIDGVVVDEFGRTSSPAVYATGDVAFHANVLTGRQARLEHWQHAQNHGIAVAHSMLGDATPWADVPWFWSHQYEHDIQLAGNPLLEDEQIIRGDVGAENFCVIYLRHGIVVGAFGFNAQRDVRGAMELIRQRSRAAEAALSDTSIDLRRLARSLEVNDPVPSMPLHVSVRSVPNNPPPYQPNRECE